MGENPVHGDQAPAPKAPNFFEFFRQMQTRVITLRFNGVLDGFDDAPLREFIKQDWDRCHDLASLVSTQVGRCVFVPKGQRRLAGGGGFAEPPGTRPKIPQP